MKKETKVTCVVCPRSCVGNIVVSGGKIESIVGFLCKRGNEYGTAEVTSPTRMLTTTIKINNAILPLLPVVSLRPLPKEKVLECAQYLTTVEVSAPVREGDILVKDILGLGVDIAAARDMDLHQGAKFD